ncbi:MAG: PD40 domain-containing protein [Vicinamibacteria bacterium]|nr:PD40 domain-containing protein [Vicinamibacteria bacterium]
MGIKDGQGALYLRRLDQFEAVLLPKTERATAPTFSPDGKRLVFFARGRVFRIDLPDGIPVEVGSVMADPVGADWGEDGRIVYTPNWSDALWTRSEQEGEPHEFTKLNRAAGEVSHRLPCFLPGGAGVLFTIKSASDQTMDEASIAIADAATGAHRILLKGGSRPRYLNDGHLVFARAGRLYAVPFDLASRSVRGAPFPVLEGVATSGGTGNALYDVTRAGDLAYLAGSGADSQARLAWEGPDRAPRILDSLDSEWISNPNLSQDFRRAIVAIGGANDKLGLVDLERGNLTRLKSGAGNDGNGVLSKDGRLLLFNSDRAGGGYRFYRMPLDGSAPPAPLIEGTGVIHSISYSAGMLGLSLDSSRGDPDAYLIAVAGDGTPAGKPVLLAGGPDYQGTPTVSPDGKLVAWVSSESGRHDVYVAHLADAGSRRRVSNQGGDEPRYNRQGTRLFYITPQGIVSVALRSAADLSFGEPEKVTGSIDAGRISGYDVAADGTSVLLSQVDEAPGLRRDIRLWPGWGRTLQAVH